MTEAVPPGPRPGGPDRGERRRVAAVIVRQGRLLMVRERNRGPTNRHDGTEFWTLPGGGVEPGETEEAAVRREVWEEVGLHARVVRPLFEYPYQSGHTTAYEVEVDAGEPRLGVDDDLGCDCPRMVGLAWVPLPAVQGDAPGWSIPWPPTSGRPDTRRCQGP